MQRFAFLSFALLCACGSGMDTDSGTPGLDAATTDAGSVDAGGGDTDAGGDSDAGGIDAGDGTDSSVPTADAGCTNPRPTDSSAIGRMCAVAPGSCPSGYTCHPLNGAILSHRCEILCGDVCDCPVGFECGPFCDKAGCTDICQPR